MNISTTMHSIHVNSFSVSVVVMLVMMMTIALPTQCAVIYVEPGPVANIQLAVDAAAPGDDVILRAGEYNRCPVPSQYLKLVKAVSIEKSISLIGEDGAVITCGNSVRLNFVAIYVNTTDASGTQIKHITVRNTTNGIVIVNNASVAITDVNIERCGYGLTAASSARVHLSHSTITTSTMSSVTAGSKDTMLTIENCTIISNTCRSQSNRGVVYSSGQARVIVNHTVIRDNIADTAAIYIDMAGNVEVFDSEIRNNSARNGMECAGGVYMRGYNGHGTLFVSDSIIGDGHCFANMDHMSQGIYAENSSPSDVEFIKLHNTTLTYNGAMRVYADAVFTPNNVRERQIIIPSK